MDTRQVAKLIGVTYGSLNADRTTSRNIGIGYIKVGRLIKYPKTEVANGSPATPCASGRVQND